MCRIGSRACVRRASGRTVVVPGDGQATVISATERCAGIRLGSKEFQPVGESHLLAGRACWARAGRVAVRCNPARLAPEGLER